MILQQYLLLQYCMPSSDVLTPRLASCHSCAIFLQTISFLFYYTHGSMQFMFLQNLWHFGGSRTFHITLGQGSSNFNVREI